MIARLALIVVCCLALPAAAAAPPTVTIVATGRRPGLVRARAAINSPTLLLDRYAGLAVQVTVVRAGPGVYAYGDYVLLARHGMLGAGEFRRAAGALVPHWDRAEPVEVLRSSYTLIVQGRPRGPRDLVAEMWAQNRSSGSIPELERLPARLVPVDSPLGPLTLVALGAAPADPADAETLPRNPELWERRDVLVSRVADATGEDHLYLVKRPLGDPARMLAAARATAEEAGPGTLLLDPGMAWPAALSEEGHASVTRRRKRAGFAAVLPSVADLRKGLLSLEERRSLFEIPFVAANLIGEDGKPAVRPWVVREVNDIRVGIVGVLPPRLLLEVPRAEAAGLRIIDPLAAAQQAVDALNALPARPDLVVLLAALRPEETATLRGRVTGADVLVGDLSRPGLVSPDRLVLFPGETPAEERRFYRNPSLVVHASPVDVTRLDLSFERRSGRRARLRGARLRTTPVTDRTDPDPVVHRAIAARQIGAAEPESEPLLPDLDRVAAAVPGLEARLRRLPDLYPTLSQQARLAYPLRFTDTLFARLAANVVRRALGAEVAVIRHIVRAGDSAGVATAGEVSRWLEGEPDRLALIRLTGKQLRALRGAVSGVEVVWSGYARPPKGGDPVVSGRPVLDDEPYLVAVADSLLGEPGVEAGLKDVAPTYRFARVGPSRWEPRPRGAPLPLRDAIRRALAGLRLADDPRALAGLLVEKGAEPEPGFRVIVESLELSGGDLNRGTEERPKVADTRVTAGQASAVGVAGTLAAELDGEAFSWRLEYGFAYESQPPDFGDLWSTVPLKDDWVAGTEVSLRRLALPVGFTAAPYTSLRYDSQFFAFPVAGEKELLRQRQLLYGLGAEGKPGDRWQAVRAGLALRWDFEAGGWKDPKPGVEASTKWSRPLGPVVWKANAALVWFPGSEVTALELDATLTNTLDFPIGRGLSFRVTQELFGFTTGEGPEAEDGVRHTLKFGLTYDRRLKPTLGLY